jgi:hypothetical protein
MSDLLKRIEEQKQARATAAANEPKPAPVAGAEESMTVVRSGEAAFIEFHLSPDNCVGYAASQLMHFQLLTRKPDLADDPTKPAQTLTIGLQTVDLVITGNRLNLITEALASSTLKAVRAIPSRYAELNLKQPYIDKIVPKELKPEEAQ